MGPLYYAGKKHCGGVDGSNVYDVIHVNKHQILFFARKILHGKQGLVTIHAVLHHTDFSSIFGF